MTGSRSIINNSFPYRYRRTTAENILIKIKIYALITRCPVFAGYVRGDPAGKEIVEILLNNGFHAINIFHQIKFVGKSE